jgi:hypothetical protein
MFAERGRFTGKWEVIPIQESDWEKQNLVEGRVRSHLREPLSGQ